MKKATKAELQTKLEGLYQEYIHFPLFTQKSLTKAQLEQRIEAMRRAIAWKRYAKRLNDQIIAEYGPAWWMTSEAHEDIEKMGNAYRKANEYWFKG